MLNACVHKLILSFQAREFLFNNYAKTCNHNELIQGMFVLLSSKFTNIPR